LKISPQGLGFGSLLIFVIIFGFHASFLCNFGFLFCFLVKVGFLAYWRICKAPKEGHLRIVILEKIKLRNLCSHLQPLSLIKIPVFFLYLLLSSACINLVIQYAKKNIIVQQKNASPHLIFSLLGDQNLSKEQHLTTTKKKNLVLKCDTCILIIGIGMWHMYFYYWYS
jgi:hypothetical protein